MDTSDPAVIEGVSSLKPLPALKRPHRSPHLKPQIVEESLALGAFVVHVERDHEVKAN
jgi:hypothetical protein